MGRRPVRLRVAYPEEKIPQQRSSLPRMVHFGMKLHPPAAPLRIADSGHGVRRLRRQMKPRRQLQSLIAMGHPHRQLCGQSVKERVLFIDDADIRVAIRASGGRDYLAAEM